MSIRHTVTRRSFGARLAEERERAGLTQAAVASELGVAQARLSEWENDKFVPAGETIIRLVGIIDADGHYLLTGDRSPTAATIAEIREVWARLGDLLGEPPIRPASDDPGAARKLAADADQTIRRAAGKNRKRRA